MSIQAARLLANHPLNSSLSIRISTTFPNSSRIRSYLTRFCWLLVLTGLVLSFVAGQPVAAQEANPVCSDESGTLPIMIEGFIQMTTALGLMGLLVVWQADELAEMFTLSSDQKQALKGHKRSAMKSAAVLVLLGPVFTVAGDMMGLPVAQCVDLIPF